MMSNDTASIISCWWFLCVYGPARRSSRTKNKQVVVAHGRAVRPPHGLRARNKRSRSGKIK